jgi:hypothetical protein
VAVPADWIGERVILVAEGLNKRLRGELAEVSDRGVVLVDAREGDAPPRNPLFCPWGKVRFLSWSRARSQKRPNKGRTGASRAGGAGGGTRNAADPASLAEPSPSG